MRPAPRSPGGFRPPPRWEPVDPCAQDRFGGLRIARPAERLGQSAPESGQQLLLVGVQPLKCREVLDDRTQPHGVIRMTDQRTVPARVLISEPRDLAWA